jgi:hypothetical protein
MNADDPTPPTPKDLTNLTQLAASIEHIKRLEADAFLTDEVSDAEVDLTLRMAGGDPKAIGRRGVEQVDRILAEHLARAKAR